MRSLSRWSSLLALALLAAFGAALAVRVLPGHDLVFHRGIGGSPDRVDFREVDPWYHVRAIEHQVANFPERFAFDPYLGFPDGGPVPVAPLLDWTIAALVLATGGAAPGATRVETIAAWVPAVAGALVVFPVALLSFRIAGRSWGRWRHGAAALAAATVAMLPGQFLARSLLGFVDHHVLEVLLSTAMLAALAASLDESRTPRQRTVSAVAAGLALAGVALAWVGAAAVVLLLLAWVAVQFAVDAWSRRPLGWLERVALPTFAIALGVFAPFYDGVVASRRNLVALVVAVIVTSLGIASARAGERWRPTGREGVATLLLAALGLGLAALAMVGLAPGVGSMVADEIGRLFVPGETVRAVSEAAPLSSTGPLVPLLWREFAMAGPFAALFGLVSLVRLRRTPSREALLLAVWSVGLFALAWAQNRFLYYLAVPVAIYAAHAAVSATRRLVARYASATDDARSRRWSVSLLSAAALVLLVGMSVAPAVARSRSWNGPTGDWHAALSWLRTSTPDPFADPATYWKSFDGDVAKPRASYTVGSWWDFGYWILRGAHRVPVANPTQAGAETMARLLLAADDAAATRLARSAGIRYLAIEASLPMLTLGEPPRPTGKFRSIARFAAERPERYLEVVERRENGTLTLHTIFHPAYYETLLVRLLLGGGAGLEPEGPVHVVELVPAGASGRRELVRLEPYATYAAARASLAGRDPARFVLAGFDPVRTCVPLAPSALFRLAYASPTPLPAVARRPGVVEIYAMEPAGAQRGATVP